MTTTSSLNSPKDFALYYRNELGFSVIPVRSDPPKERKDAALSWKAFEHRPATVEEIENWFRMNPNFNIGVACGNVSNIIAIDVDGPTATRWLEEKIPEMSVNLQIAIKNTLYNRTGSGGTHIILRLAEPTDIGGAKLLWTDGKPHSEIKLKGNGGYIVMAPSIHPNGNKYELRGERLGLITKAEINELSKVLSPQAVVASESEPSRKRESTETSQTRTLTDKQSQELMQWISPYYIDGSRNDIIYYLSGMFRIGGFTQDTARAFVTELCNSSPYQDEDLEKSLEVVDNTYEKAAEEVKGVSGLRETLVVGFEGSDNIKEYLARCETFSRICQIFNHQPPPPPPPTPKETQGQQPQQSQPGETDTEIKVRGLTETLERHYKFAAIEETDELFYFVDNKGYAPAEPLVKAQVEKQYPGVITATVTNVIEKLVRRYLTPCAEFDKDIYILNMANGLYDIRTNTLRPHTWEYLTLASNQLPIKFDPKARTQKFGKFLSEVNYPNQIRTTFEAMAYTFLRDNPFEMYWILLGFGSNGKSVLMHVLTKLHGEDNVAHTSLVHLLGNRFSKMELEGKNVNIDMEMSSATIEDMSMLKELTGSEPIRIEPKYKNAYTAPLWAKHFLLANEMPIMKDYTDARFRREGVIAFPNQFVEGENANPNLKHELIIDEELSGIFNALMIPLRRIALEHKPPYMDAKTIKDRKFKHQLVTEPIKTFLEFATEPKDYESDADITKEELYEGYKKFCAFYKVPWQKYDQFCGAVKRSGVKDDRETWGDRKRVWVGIRLKKSMFEDTLTV